MKINLDATPGYSTHNQADRAQSKGRFSALSPSSLSQICQNVDGASSSNCFFKCAYAIYDLIQRVFHYLCCCFYPDKNEDEPQDPSGKDKESSKDLSGFSDKQQQAAPNAGPSTSGKIASASNGPRIVTLNNLPQPPPAPKPKAAPNPDVELDVASLVNSVRPVAYSPFASSPHLIIVCERVVNYQKTKTGPVWGDKHIQYLLSQGVSLQDKDKEGKTALHFASSVEVAQILLGRDPSLATIPDNEGRLPIHTIQDPNICALLLQSGGDVNVKDKSLKTPLHHAQTKEKIEFLLKNGADVNALDINGRSFLSYILMQAAKTTNMKQQQFYSFVAENLIVAMADINIPMEKGSRRTFLHFAIANGLITIFDCLMKRKADLNALDENGVSPLEEAFKKIANTGIDEFALKLIHAKARVDLSFTSGNLPINDAAKYGYHKIIGKLKDAGADMNAKNAEGKTPLWIAVECNQATEAALLVALKADLCCTVGTRKENLLHLAVSKDARGLVSLFVKSIDINAQNDAGQTALAIALEKGFYGIAKQLIEAGADISVRFGEKRQTVLHIAAKVGDKELLETLFKHADLNALDADGMTPLGIALVHDKYLSAALLINGGCNLDLGFGTNKMIPLRYVCGKAHTNAHFAAIGELLIQKGAKIGLSGDSLNVLWNFRGLVDSKNALSYLNLLKAFLTAGAKLDFLHRQVSRCDLLFIELLMHGIEDEGVRGYLLELRQHSDAAVCIRISDSKRDLLFSVIEHQEPDLIKYFTDCLDAVDILRSTPIGYALECLEVSHGSERIKFISVIEQLMLQKAIPFAMKEGSKDTPLHFAIENRLFDVIDLFLKEPARLKAVDDLGRVPLAVAFEMAASFEISYSTLRGEAEQRKQRTCSQYFALINQLIPLSPLNVPMKNGSRQKLVHFAVENCGGEIRRQQQPNDPAGPMQDVHVQSQFFSIIKSIASHQLRWNEVDDLGRTCLGIVIENMAKSSAHCHNMVLFQYVLNESVKQRDFARAVSVPIRESSPSLFLIHFAVAKKLTRVVGELIQSGLREDLVNVGSDRGPPLSIACENKDFEMAALLVAAGASVNITCQFKGQQSTPLHAAIACRDLPFIQTLLDRNVDLHLTDQENRTAIQFAQEHLDLVKSQLEVLRDKVERIPAEEGQLAELDGDKIILDQILMLLNQAAAN